MAVSSAKARRLIVSLHVPALRPGSRLWKIACVLCWLVVFTGMLAPGEAVARFELRHFDKVLHLVALTGMTLSARLAFPGARRLLFWPLLLVLAVTLEITQSVLQPSRDFSYLDIVANLCGVGLGALGWRLWRALL